MKDIKKTNGLETISNNKIIRNFYGGIYEYEENYQPRIAW
jgi:hypothetical protein